MPQRAPGVPPPNALAWARYRSTLPGLSPQQQAENDVREQVAGQPIEQQQQAVQAAVKFQAQRGYQQDLAGGMSASQAMAKWGPMLFAPGSPGAMQSARMQQPQYRNVPGVGLVQIGPGGQPKVVMPSKQAADTETVTEKYPAKEGTPAVQASKGFFGLGAHPAVPEVPAVPEHTVTRKQPRITPPSGAGGSMAGRVKVKDRDGKTGTIPADQVDAAKAAGYTIVQ
jgi:hypothetical protein